MLKRFDDEMPKIERKGPSRRTFLIAGAAAGGGLLLGVYLPRSIGAMAREAEETFAPNAFVRIRPDDSITLVMPQVEMGQGTYTSMSMLIAEELEVDLAKMGLEGAPERQTLCQSAPRLPGHRWFDIGARILGAAPSRRRDRSRHVDRGGGGSVERRSGLMPRRKGCSGLADRANDQLRSSGRRGSETAGARQGRTQRSQGLHPDRNACQTTRHA